MKNENLSNRERLEELRTGDSSNGEFIMAIVEDINAGKTIYKEDLAKVLDERALSMKDLRPIEEAVLAKGNGYVLIKEYIDKRVGRTYNSKPSLSQIEEQIDHMLKNICAQLYEFRV